MGAYLIDHPPRQRQFKARGTTISGVTILHTAESLPDFHGPDTGAEGVARFIQQRSDFGSYHKLCDSDSRILLVPLSMQAYGEGTGTNPHAMHISAATQAHKWESLPDQWVEDTIVQMAHAAHECSDELERVHKVRIPARRIEASQARNRVEGFVTHAQMDPSRRSDPGKDFRWALFMDTYADLERGETKATRGKYIDLGIRRSSAALTALDDAKVGPGERGDKVRMAMAQIEAGRRTLRTISLLGDDDA
jgi:hypothetical protein